ncbi:hypothetical protein, partial [Phytoactinopolyspora endophytica]|uniref:hypothetical protein n=1 Tax=Phytoactinopolyspora endophytica TaxID=1642495 RepID=UPI0013EBA044
DPNGIAHQSDPPTTATETIHHILNEQANDDTTQPRAGPQNTDNSNTEQTDRRNTEQPNDDGESHSGSRTCEHTDGYDVHPDGGYGNDPIGGTREAEDRGEAHGQADAA